jgi:hypothetical protein
VIQLLLRPRATFLAWISTDIPGSVWRRPLALALAFGVMTSAFASGRLSMRLIVDGAISFAFVPVIDIAMLAVVVRAFRPRRRVPFATLVDLFCTGHAPWLFWMLALAVTFSIVSPRDISEVFSPFAWTFVIPAIWSLWIDVRFFETVTGRTRHGAIVDALVHRALAWTLALVYFYGIAAYALVMSTVPEWSRP